MESTCRARLRMIGDRHAYDQDFRNTRNDVGRELRCHGGIGLSSRLCHVRGRLLPRRMSAVDERLSPMRGGSHANDDHACASRDRDDDGSSGGGVLLDAPQRGPLGDTLREYGFVPIRPPSNLMNVGSLYYVDSRVKDFKAICNAEEDDLKDSVVSSRSWEMQENLERNGRFATGVKADVGLLLNSGLDHD